MGYAARLRALATVRDTAKAKSDPSIRNLLRKMVTSAHSCVKTNQMVGRITHATELVTEPALLV